ncbi:metacaspase-1-like [Ricinus communis]|uniref:metacaspase-1-like n=1 Tax=Ricinus communis TaxID=3988 RepID=UPI00201B0DD1|nr:metacaspase-1-like [Ricinus communis]
MASRRERCSWCGVQLLVPAEAQSIRCSLCQAITKVQPHDHPLAQVRDTINHAATRIINMVSTTVTGPVSSYAGGGGGGTTYGYGYYVQPQPPRPVLLPLPSAHGRKRAVLCGVSYRGKSYKIKGSINDVNCMRYFLVEKLGFPNDSILILTEDETSPVKIPTKENMRLALRWLVQGCQAGDSLVFHFSGHGSQVPDSDMDEIDGFDETLCPLDYETEGMIVDDEINETIVRPLPKGATLHAIIDSCYSGTILDLPFVCKMNREGYYTWEEQKCPQDIYKGTSGGLALCFSACNDNQISVDTNALAGNAATGALTYSFIQAVENEPGLTYGRLLNAMRQAIRGAKTGGLRLSGPIASLINRALFNTEITQEPQLSSSDKFDIYAKQFLL